jgi:hypothetical protein
MSKHESRIPLRHMLDHAREAYALIQNKSREDLDADRLLNLAWSAYWKSLVRQQAESPRKNVSTILEYHGRRLSP